MSTRHEPNQPITLATTKIVEVAGQTVDIPVEVILHLSPYPILVIESKQLPNIVLTKERFYISLANGAKFEACVDRSISLQAKARWCLHINLLMSLTKAYHSGQSILAL